MFQSVAIHSQNIILKVNKKKSCQTGVELLVYQNPAPSGPNPNRHRGIARPHRPDICLRVLWNKGWPQRGLQNPLLRFASPLEAIEPHAEERHQYHHQRDDTTRSETRHRVARRLPRTLSHSKTQRVSAFHHLRSPLRGRPPREPLRRRRPRQDPQVHGGGDRPQRGLGPQNLLRVLGEPQLLLCEDRVQVLVQGGR